VVELDGLLKDRDMLLIFVMLVAVEEEVVVVTFVELRDD